MVWAFTNDFEKGYVEKNRKKKENKMNKGNCFLFLLLPCLYFIIDQSKSKNVCKKYSIGGRDRKETLKNILYS